MTDVEALKAKHGIVTEHTFPPIPRRDWDWHAFYDGDEPRDSGEDDVPGGMDFGEGPTEAAAVADLLENHPREATI